MLVRLAEHTAEDRRGADAVFLAVMGECDDEERGTLLEVGGRSIEPAMREVMRDSPKVVEIQKTRRQWFEQPGTIMIATIAALMVFGAVLGGEESFRHAVGGRGSESDLAVGTAWQGNGTTRTISMEEMLEQETVQTWLRNIGIVWGDLTWTEKLKYLPSRLTVYIDLEGIDQGTGASSGYIAFNIANNAGSNQTEYASSFLVVLDYASGDIELFLPTFDAQSFPGLGTTNLNTTFCGLKFKDPGTMLLGGNAQQTEYGGSFTLRWQEKILDFQMLPGGERTSHNCHDIQWSHDDLGYWTPGGGGLGNAVNKFDAATGERTMDLGFMDYTQDINHCQLVEEDTRAYLSSRLTSAVLRVNATTGAIDWVAGGADGTFTIYNLDGTIYAPGDFAFYDQHNAEYFGENEIYMVDNQYMESSPSFFRVYSVDEAAQTLTELWNYAYAKYPYGNMPFYGDLDRLPTGNVLTTFWPGAVENSTQGTLNAEFYISEIDRDEADKVVWQLDVFGLVANDCEATGSVSACARDDWGGWRAYSAERFYMKPLVYDASCRVSPDNSTFLRFNSVNSIKQNNVAKASWRVAQQGVPEGESWTGDFGFVPHWRSTSVKHLLAPKSLAGSLMTLTVTNEWDAHETVDLACVASDDTIERAA